MKPGRNSKPLQIGNVTVGGGAPIVVQSMTKTDTRDIMSTISQIRSWKIALRVGAGGST